MLIEKTERSFDFLIPIVSDVLPLHSEPSGVLYESGLIVALFYCLIGRFLKLFKLNSINSGQTEQKLTLNLSQFPFKKEAS